MSFKNIIAAIITALLLSTCTSSLYVPTNNDAVIHNIPLDTLKAGRKLYADKCSSCHNLYLPSEYTKEEWYHFIEEMQEPAKIDDSQKELIAKYLGLSSKKQN